MRKHFTMKRVIVLAVVALAIGIAGGALAYFTASGSGSGTANAGTAGTLVLHATFDPGLVPGTSKDVAFTADNASDTNLYVATISFDSVTSSDSGCQDVIDLVRASSTWRTSRRTRTVPGGRRPCAGRYRDALLGQLSHSGPDGVRRRVAGASRHEQLEPCGWRGGLGRLSTGRQEGSVCCEG